MRGDRRNTGRSERREALTMRSWGDGPVGPGAAQLPDDVILECGWGRLIFAHTFSDPRRLAEVLREEEKGRRDIAFYARDPHVIVAHAPQELFLDPSHTYRLWLSDYRPPAAPARGFLLRRLRTEADGRAVNRLYTSHNMVTVASPKFFVQHRKSRALTYLLAVDHETDEVIGTVTGVDHVEAFGDPEHGCSLWCLAVDPRTQHPGVGQALVQQLAEHYIARGRAFMDLSVLHDNDQAIALYEKLGFQRVPGYCVKHKNPINEDLFVGRGPEAPLNPYARIIADEALRRGIDVEVLDEDSAILALTFGGRRVLCRESLSELTTAVAMTVCDDKALTRTWLERAGLRVPAQLEYRDSEEDLDFLRRHERIVVKPARGEQGAGVAVDITTPEELEAAVEAARAICDRVLLEEFVEGEDLRLIVIGDELVAAAVRRPPQVTGTGRYTIRELIEKQSRRRAAATGGESRIPIDVETERRVRRAGHALDDVLEAGETVVVRRAANLHTGGTIHDVTDRLHPELRSAAVEGAQALAMPVVGLDFIVPAVDGPEYVVIEANERPGLANHEPQPTAERFIDLLFPRTVSRRMRA